MENIIYPTKFKDKIKRFFSKQRNEPSITLTQRQLLSLFLTTKIYNDLKELNPSTNMVELKIVYDENGRADEFTFYLFNQEERNSNAT